MTRMKETGMKPRKPHIARTLRALFVGCLFLGAGMSGGVRLLFAFEEVEFIREIKTGLACPVDVAVGDDGEIYTLDRENSRVSIFESNGDFRQNFDEPDPESARMREPRSLAVSPRGRIVVADTGNHRIQVFNRAGKLLFAFGAEGPLPGQFRSPTGVTVDHFGFIFVADRDNRRIQIFSPNGIFVDAFETEYRPADLGTDPQRNVYVLCPEISRVVIYSPSGKKLQDIPCVMDGRDYLSRANGITVDPRGDIYITDGSENSVKKFDRNERILISFGSEGEGRGQFVAAAGLTFDAADHLYIADSQNSRVQIFRITGSRKEVLSSEQDSPLVLDFDSTIAAEEGVTDLFSVPGKGLYMLCDQTGHIRVKGRKQGLYGQTGSAPGEFLGPQAMSVSLDGQIFVADTDMHRIQILNEEGLPTYLFGKVGSKPSQFNRPAGIAVNGRGDIYVADTRNNRVQIFNYDGIYLSSFGLRRDNRKGGTDAELRLPAAMAVDSKNRVFVLCPEQNRIQIYGQDGQYWGSIGEKGSAVGQFDNPVDIALDENNNIYVADRGNHRVQVFNNQGKPVLAFGSPGKGGGYFQELSAVTVSEGKIYVADYATDYIQVFQYLPWGKDQGRRIYATKTANPPEEEGKNNIARYRMAQEAAEAEAVAELAETTGVPPEQIVKLINIDSVTSLNNGQVKVTLSIPQKFARQEDTMGEKALTLGGRK